MNAKDKVKYVLLRAVQSGPTLLRGFQRSYKNINLPRLYRIAWELEAEGKIICLDFCNTRYGDTLCFEAGTTITQPGIKMLLPVEEEFVKALKNKGIMVDSDLATMAPKDKILFVRTLMHEFISNPPAGHYFQYEYQKILAEFISEEK